MVNFELNKSLGRTSSPLWIAKDHAKRSIYVLRQLEPTFEHKKLPDDLKKRVEGLFKIIASDEVKQKVDEIDKQIRIHFTLGLNLDFTDSGVEILLACAYAHPDYWQYFHEEGLFEEDKAFGIDGPLPIRRYNFTETKHYLQTVRKMPSKPPNELFKEVLGLLKLETAFYEVHYLGDNRVKIIE